MLKCVRCGKKVKMKVLCPDCIISKRGRPRRYNKAYSLQEIAKATNTNISLVWRYFQNYPIVGHKKKTIENFLKINEK